MTEEHYKVATEVAHVDPTPEKMLPKMKHLWPAALIPMTIHYGKPKFQKVKLNRFESDAVVKQTAVMKNYRFNPNEVWSEESEDDSDKENQPSTSKSRTTNDPTRNLFLDTIQDEMESENNPTSTSMLLDSFLNNCK